MARSFAQIPFYLAKHGCAAFAGCVGGLSYDGLDSHREKSLMKREEKTKDHGEEPQHQPHRVRLPEFLIEEETGLGDAIKRVTYGMGIQPCGGCEKRAAALNRWIYFSR
jgi:hypothetical protein